jgi:hypothetical protein
MILHAATDGTMRCIYDEVIRLGSLGSLSIQRASHVEPNPDGSWSADLSPVGGPRFDNFPDRSTALKAELDWLEDNWLSG